jgi:predicted protein tyrosine phosphatase
MSTNIIIEVLSRREAGEMLSSERYCSELTYLLSIGDVYDELPEGYQNIQRKQRLLVADVTTEDGPSEADVQRIIDLAEHLRSDTGKLLIHCEAGVSRSTAAALIIYACWLGPGGEHEAMERVLAQRPCAFPNSRMVAFADRLLGLDGRLLAALKQAMDEKFKTE